MNMTTRIKHIQQRILEVAFACHRHPEDITLLAVSKGHSSSDIKEAYHAGVNDFGENYLQEALLKIKALSAQPLCWHFIGPIQSNKTKDIAHYFSWVHSVSRLKIAQQLNDARPDVMPRLKICIQVNLDDEESKSGISPNAVKELALALLQLPRLELRGLMLLPKYEANSEAAYLSFLRLKDLLHQLNQQLNINMDTLSMGMSHDFEAAIRAGSTLVRIGTALFGERGVNR